jgi:hypothetical protein
MRGRRYEDDEQDDAYMAGYARGNGADADYEAAQGGYDERGEYEAPLGQGAYEDDERGLVLQQEESLVGVSSIVTQHGTPILSFTRTMNRFYTSRKQRLSLGRHRCEVCGDRIRFWSYETPTGNHTHDGCYERLAWTWTNQYAQQQRLAAEGRLD